MAFQSEGFLYYWYKGSCIAEKEYFKKHDVAIVAPTAKSHEGTVVKPDNFETTGTQRGSYIIPGDKQTRMRLNDIRFGLIPVQPVQLDPGVLDWLAARNHSFPAKILLT